MPVHLTIDIERFPIAGAFTISRGSRTEAVVVIATLRDGPHVGRGECVPYARYGESVDSVVGAISALERTIADGLDREALQRALPAGAARNALDCAFWDLDAKRQGRPVYDLAGLSPLRSLTTAYTISLGTPEVMADAARQAANRPLLKLKLGGAGDPERLAAIRVAAPKADLIVDANEAWSVAELPGHLAACAAAKVTLIEQPLPAGSDAALADVDHLVPICADESLHDRASLSGLRGKYDAINIKLDKAGGLTEALALADDAERLGFRIMVGCMVSTSLAIAPAVLVAQRAAIVDLDGPLLLARDRDDGIRYEGSMLHPPPRSLWG